MSSPDFPGPNILCGAESEVKRRINQLIWDSVALDVSIYLVLMIAVIAESIKHLSQRQVRKAVGYFFGRDTKSPHFDKALTGVRVPLMMGSPLRMPSSLTI